MKSTLVLLAALLGPSVAFAQYSSGISKITDAESLADRLLSLGDIALYLLVSLAVLYIVYATVQYFIKGKSGDEGRGEAGMHIFYGIVGLAIIVSIWGLVAILTNTFATQTDAIPDLPRANFLNTNGTAPSGASFSGSSGTYSAPTYSGPSYPDTAGGNPSGQDLTPGSSVNH